MEVSEPIERPQERGGAKKLRTGLFMKFEKVKISNKYQLQIPISIDLRE
jgi:hypothetical protein